MENPEQEIDTSAPKDISFTTAGGKAVSFQAKRPRGRPKGSTKKVVETPVVVPEEPPVDPLPVAIPETPVVVPDEPPADPLPVAPKPKRKPKAAPGLSKELPPAPPPPTPPPLERQPSAQWQPSPEELHSMLRDYLGQSRRQSRESRINMYRSWLQT